MIKVNLKKNNGFEWQFINGINFKGYFSDEADVNFYKRDDNYFKFDISRFKERLNGLNGFFSFVYVRDGMLFAAVDKLRSIPLFYCHFNSDFFISDNANWIKEQINEKKLDEISSEEFLLTGYVTGSDTLFTSIKQINAGECLNYYEEANKLVVSRYFEYRHQNFSISSVKELVTEMDTLHISVFKRLIKTLNGRQVVIPLSGGYDSKLIAIMLKRLNYENIICFTYGKPGNKESKISKYVANTLGLKWYFVSYDEEKWIKCCKTNEYVQYVDYASHFCSLAHIQDFLAVKELKELGIINNDAIFIPGHAYDFLAGSHIPKWFVSKKFVSKDDLINSIIKKHYNLWRWDRRKKEINQKIRLKLINNIGFTTYNGNEQVADDFEYWDWKERQSKFICNSVRVYEYWGYEWRLPLWDNELITFWSKIPIHLRVNRNLFFEYVKSNHKFRVFENKKISNISKVINFIKNKIPNGVHSSLYSIKLIIFDQQGWFGIYSKNMKIRYFYKKGANINSGLALDYLNKIKDMNKMY